MAASTTALTPTMNAAEELLGPPLARGLADQPALWCGERVLTYGDLAALVNRFGNGLRARGVGIENRVLVMLKDTPEFVAAYIAAMKIGAVPAGVNSRAAAKELLGIIEDSRCAVLLIDADFLPVLDRIGDQLGHRPLVVVAGGDGGDLTCAALIDGQSPDLDAVAMSPDDMAFWIYTSGTTGLPKATVHLHHDIRICDRFLVEKLGVKPGDKIFSTSKLFFAYALGHSLMGGLRAGAQVILHADWPDAETIADLVETHRPDLLFTVPTLYRNLMESGVADRSAFKVLRHCISAGERLPETLFARWRAVTGHPILEGIGASEAAFLFIANAPDAHRAGSCGRVLPWARAELRDGAGAVITTPDTPGILWVAMDSLCDRYWNRQAKSRDVFVAGWYCTGDMCACDKDGWWRHLGRGDEMIKISGQWVSPMEIESHVLDIAQISDAAVTTLPNADGLERLALFVVPEAGQDRAACEAAILATLTERLAIYKCPRRITFIDEIPRTVTGKTQRFKLKELTAP